MAALNVDWPVGPFNTPAAAECIERERYGSFELKAGKYLKINSVLGSGVEAGNFSEIHAAKKPI